MQRNIACDVQRPNGATTKRVLLGPETWSLPDGSGQRTLPRQSLLLARNVGMHMTTDAVVTAAEGAPTPEHFMAP